jgi:WD40 repeat protein
MATGNEKITLKGHTASILSLAFGADGVTLASSSVDDGKTFVTAGNDGAAHIWEPATGAELQRFQLGPTDGKIGNALFDPTGRYLL